MAVRLLRIQVYLTLYVDLVNGDSNILEFQKVILKSDGEFREATEVSRNVRVKRLVLVSPSISRPQKSSLPVTERRTARTSLTFENIQHLPVNPSYVEVAACFLNTLSYIKL